MMDEETAVDIIKRKFQDAGSPVKIPLQRGGSFTAKLVEYGLEVDNLRDLPFLPWKVFDETVNLLAKNGGKAERGDAMSSRLGDEGLPLDSIEGHLAHVVYGKQVGDSVFRRISPIVAILVWAGICENAPRELILL